MTSFLQRVWLVWMLPILYYTVLMEHVQGQQQQRQRDVMWNNVKQDFSEFTDMSTFAMLNLVLSGAELLDGMTAVYTAALNATLARVEATLNRTSLYNQQPRIRRNVTIVQIVDVLNRPRLARVLTAYDQLVAAGYSYMLVYWIWPENVLKAEETAMLSNLLPEETFTLLDYNSFDSETKPLAHFYCNNNTRHTIDYEASECYEFLSSHVRRKLADDTTDSHHLHWLLGADVHWVGDLSTIVQKLTPSSEVLSMFSGLGEFGDCLQTTGNKSIASSETALGFLAGMSSCLNSNVMGTAPIAVVDYISVCDVASDSMISSDTSLHSTYNPLKQFSHAIRKVISHIDKLRQRLFHGICKIFTGQSKKHSTKVTTSCPTCRTELARFSGKYLAYTYQCLLANYRAQIETKKTDSEQNIADVNMMEKCGCTINEKRRCPHVLSSTHGLTTYNVLGLGLRDGVLFRDWRIQDRSNSKSNSMTTSREEYEWMKQKVMEEGKEPLIFNKKPVLFRAVDML